jgi:hypothetical protein
MAKIRVIRYIGEFENDIEGVYFTEDLEMNANDVVDYECKLVSDDIIECEMPSCFPMDWNLIKRF